MMKKIESDYEFFKSVLHAYVEEHDIFTEEEKQRIAQVKSKKMEKKNDSKQYKSRKIRQKR